MTTSHTNPRVALSDLSAVATLAADELKQLHGGHLYAGLLVRCPFRRLHFGLTNVRPVAILPFIGRVCRRTTLRFRLHNW